MLDNIRSALAEWLAQSTALSDWAQWVIVLLFGWLLSIGAGFTPKAGKWALSKATYYTGLQRLGRRVAEPAKAWLARPSKSTMIHQLVQTQLHNNREIAELKDSLKTLKKYQGVA